MTKLMTEVLERLRGESESESNGWGSVYLDNAIPRGMTRRTFAGVLSALEKDGLYKPVRNGGDHDGIFGKVKMAEAA